MEFGPPEQDSIGRIARNQSLMDRGRALRVVSN